MTDPTPKAFDFGEEPPSLPDPPDSSAAPRAFDFGNEGDGAIATPPAGPGLPRELSFDDLMATPASVSGPAPQVARALFESEDHAAVRDAMATARAEYPALFERAEQRLAALFRRILPVRLALVIEWAEQPLKEHAAVLQPITELVLTFTKMAVPTLLATALESTQPAAGVLGKLFRRPMPPAHYKPMLIAARVQLLQLMADSETALHKLESSVQSLTLHWAVLAVISKLASGARDAALLDALVQRRTLIQQAVRQAELSILQMGQVRQQAADLIGQVSSFLTVTLPALEMAQAQGGV